MKQNLEILTEADIDNIEYWLRIPCSISDYRCPFIKPSEDNCDKCKAIFPRLRRPGFHLGLCPCEQFEAGYVRKVAKEIVKKREK